jgi:dTDP-4-dehydrorhamnose 3,5-epimerase
MNVSKTSLPDVMIFACPPAADERGHFSMNWDERRFREAGVDFSPTSACHSHNESAGTLRGMHYQEPPHAQAKVVCCTRGAILDVVVDLRIGTPTHLRWHAIELREGDGMSVFIPRGCAHGFLTLEPRSTVSYLLDGEYQPQSARVLRWDDPAVGIHWPCRDPILSLRDRQAPLYRQ